MSISNTLGQAALTAIRTALNGGNLYLYAGAVPADADDALNMATTHTQLCKFTESDDGTTGLTFDAASGAGMTKATAEAWESTINFVGYESAASTLTPTFWRFCTAGDNGQGAAASPRLQGTAGGPFTDLPCGDLTDNGTNTLSVDTFAVMIEAT